MPRLPALKLKLRPPRLREPHVARPALVAHVESAFANGAWVLLSAPAGYGKSSLAAEVVQSASVPVVWITVDAEDDLARFAVHVLAGHESAGLVLGDESRLCVDEGDAEEDLALGLLNDLVDLEVDRMLVIDDLHAASGRAVHDVVMRLASSTPPGLRLLVCTRSEPEAPLHRMRASGSLLQLRGSDLALDPAAISAALERRTGKALSPAETARVHGVTGGWPLAVQLVAASVSRGVALDRCLSGLDGNADLLAVLSREVLDTFDPALRRHVLALAPLDEISPALCEAVVPGSDGEALVRELDRLNAFVAVSEDARAVHRAHPMWSAFLREQAARELGAEAAKDVLARASSFYEAANQTGPAIELALRAGDVARASALLERTALELLGRGEGDAVLRWTEALGPDARSSVIAVARAWSLMLAYRWREAGEEAALLVTALASDAERALRGHAAAMLGSLALVEGDLAKGEAWMRQATDCLPLGDPTLAVVHGELGAAQARAGDLGAARANLTKAAGFARANPLVARGASWHLAELDLQAGDIGEAWRSHERALSGDPSPLHASRAALAELAREGDRLDEAESRIAPFVDAARAAGDAYALVLGLVGRARIAASRGRFDVARDHLVEAGERTGRARLRVAAAGVAALRVVLACQAEARGDAAAGLDEAEAALARVIGGDIEAPAHLLASNVAIELVGLAMARVELVRRAPGPALAALERWRARAEAQGRTRSVLEIDLLADLSSWQTGAADARTRYAAAARAAARAGFARLAMEDEPLGERMETRSASLPSSPRETSPLSRRELEVLALVAEGSSTAETARRLHVSPATAKKHLENIYARLQVSSRTQAVAVARRLGLLP